MKTLLKDEELLVVVGGIEVPTTAYLQIVRHAPEQVAEMFEPPFVP